MTYKVAVHDKYTAHKFNASQMSICRTCFVWIYAPLDYLFPKRELNKLEPILSAHLDRWLPVRRPMHIPCTLVFNVTSTGTISESEIKGQYILN